jgi:ornithine carbamoyltransferase
MRHLRTVSDVGESSTLLELLARARVLKRARRERKLVPTLAGQVVALLFENESTRTRLSFEAGVKMIGGSVVTMQSRDTQLSHGEPFRDAARVIGRYVDALVTRSHHHETVEEYARYAGIPVVNGLSDLDHPCQVLTDVFTVYERREQPFEAKWAWVGDASPAANGYIAAAGLLGFELRLAVPEGRPLNEKILRRAQQAGANVLVTDDPYAAVEGADVVTTAAWGRPLAGQQLERFRVDADLIARAHDDCFVLHSLPAQRGWEISDNVLEGRHSLAFEQAGNRLCVQQAVVEWLLQATPDA